MIITAAICDNAIQAVQQAAEQGRKAIHYDGLFLVCDEAELLRIESAGVEFGILHYCASAGRVVCVPVN
jgi:hypothetical protein